jgi:hypothetical protein
LNGQIIEKSSQATIIPGRVVQVSWPVQLITVPSAHTVSAVHAPLSQTTEVRPWRKAPSMPSPTPPVVPAKAIPDQAIAAIARSKTVARAVCVPLISFPSFVGSSGGMPEDLKRELSPGAEN